ncbi:MAG: GNAT family N-acetyltransferase [Acidimicrobiia bacterium]
MITDDPTLAAEPSPRPAAHHRPAAPATGLGPRVWVAYIATAAVAALLYFLLPKSLPTKIVLYNGVGLSAVVALGVAIRRNRPENARAWTLIMAGATSFLTADIVYYVLEAVSETTPFPSPADLFYLGMYPLVISGLVSLLRRDAPRRDWAGLIDAGVVAVATFGVLGVLVMDTYIEDPTLAFGGRLISLAYPVMDVALIAVAARLSAVVHLRHPSYALLTGGLVSLLVADAIYGILNSAGMFETGGVADAFWMGFYVLIGAAALHPASGRTVPRREMNRGHLSATRLVVLCLVVVTMPVIDLIWGKPVDKWLTTTASVVMFLLVLARLMGLMRIVQDKERQARRDALHDPLTGLANRVLFNERIAELGNSAPERIAAVLFIDLDDFKLVNDSLGHQAGDELLGIAAGRLLECVRPEDVVARLSGDEFAVLLVSAVDRQDAVTVARRIQEALASPFSLSSRDVTISASVGVTVEQRGEIVEPELLLRAADAAMYHAKSQGKGRFEFFEPAMYLETEDKLALKNDLQSALQRGEFEVFYQPIVRMTDRRITAVEALLRWHHPERGLVPPDRFIPLAEQNGLIVPIGRWVLRESCEQIARWRRLDPARAPQRVCVNLSARQLSDPNLFADVADALADSGIEASALTLELTESMLIEDTVRGTKVLERLKAMNVRIAIDDFGTGYSSLSYLSRFAVDTIKIDRSFVQEVEDAGISSALVKTIIELARTIGVDVVAEGIETEAQYEVLEALHCTSGQGYHFARPMGAAAAAELIIERNAAIDAEAPAVAAAAAPAPSSEPSEPSEPSAPGGPAERASRGRSAARATAAAKRSAPAVELHRGLHALRGAGGALAPLLRDLGAPVAARPPWLLAWSSARTDWEPLTFLVRRSARARIEAAALLAQRDGEVTSLVALGDGPIAVAPLFARSTAGARTLAAGVAEHLDGLDGPWELRIGQLPAHSPLTGALVDAVSGAELLAVEPVPSLVFGPDRSLAPMLSSNMSRQLRRARHRLDADGRTMLLDTLAGERSVRAILPVLRTIHLERDHAAGRSSDLDDHSLRRFWEEVVLAHAGTGELEVTTLAIDDDIAAYVIGFVDAAAYRVFDGHFDSRFARYSPGRLVEATVIERAMARPELTELDWMAGVAAEKLLAANALVDRVELIARSPRLPADADADADAGAEASDLAVQQAG